MNQKQLKDDINFELYCTKEEQKELLKLNNKVNKLLVNPARCETGNQKEKRKLNDSINKTFSPYSTPWVIASDIINQL